MLSSKKIRFVAEYAPGAMFCLTERGLEISVSLNIKSEMVKFLTPNVKKSKFFYVYTLRTTIQEINSISVSNTYNTLLGKAMANCRRAKQLVLQEEINRITWHQQQLNF